MVDICSIANMLLYRCFRGKFALNTPHQYKTATTDTIYFEHQSAHTSGLVLMVYEGLPSADHV